MLYAFLYGKCSFCSQYQMILLYCVLCCACARFSPPVFNYVNVWILRMDLYLRTCSCLNLSRHCLSPTPPKPTMMETLWHLHCLSAGQVFRLRNDDSYKITRHEINSLTGLGNSWSSSPLQVSHLRCLFSLQTCFQQWRAVSKVPLFTGKAGFSMLYLSLVLGGYPNWIPTPPNPIHWYLPCSPFFRTTAGKVASSNGFNS